jgi:RecA-family ATPase
MKYSEAVLLDDVPFDEVEYQEALARALADKAEEERERDARLEENRAYYRKLAAARPPSPVYTQAEHDALIRRTSPLNDHLAAPGVDQATTKAENAPKTEPAPKPKIVSPSTLVGPPPARQWIVREWLPVGVVTGLYGDGGLGKSLLAQQLQTATALSAGRWLGLPADCIASLGVYCEDSEDELWRRQDDINRSYGVERTDIGRVNWMSRIGEDNLLMTFARNGAGELTPFYAQVLEAALDLKARLVIIDTASDTFGGDENNRSQVRQFVSRALGSIALKIGGAVILCAHPSRTGLASGEGDGGSTGWSNAFRSRLFLHAPAQEAGEQPDSNARILERRKANYAARNDALNLRWREGVIEPDGQETSDMANGKADAEEVFLDLARDAERQNSTISDNTRAGNFAPRTFGRLPRDQRRGLTEADFTTAMARLLKSGRIENLPYGRAGDRRTRIIVPGMTEASGIDF